MIPLLLLGGIILLIASTIVKGAIIDQVENSLKGTAIATQAAYDQNAGTYLHPALILSQNSVTLFPTGVIAPIPVITTLFFMRSCSSF